MFGDPVSNPKGWEVKKIEKMQSQLKELEDNFQAQLQLVFKQE
jgi:hypothetical protein